MVPKWFALEGMVFGVEKNVSFLARWLNNLGWVLLILLACAIAASIVYILLTLWPIVLVFVAVALVTLVVTLFQIWRIGGEA